MGVSGAGMVMLCLVLHVVHCMSFGSNESEMFWYDCLLLIVRDARKVLLIVLQLYMDTKLRQKKQRPAHSL